MTDNRAPDPQITLDLLYEELRQIDKAIGDVEKDIAVWLPRMTDRDQVATFLQSRHESLRHHAFERGRTAARIEEWERRAHEQEATEAERTLDEAGSRPSAPPSENLLDWLGKVQDTVGMRLAADDRDEPDHDPR